MIIEWFTFAAFAILVGFRHGMDSDHVAAIADMVGTEQQRGRQLRMGLTYALGHGAIVVIMGLLAIYAGSRLPQELLTMMEGLVGLSLLLLGAFILYSVYRQKQSYQYESRWMILYRMAARLFNRKGKENVNVSKLGVLGAFFIGIIHGIGAETPTQVLVISSSAGLDNVAAACIQLALFTFGLLMATILVTYLASWGFMKAKLKSKAYLLLGLITGLYSVFLGISIISGI